MDGRKKKSMNAPVILGARVVQRSPGIFVQMFTKNLVHFITSRKCCCFDNRWVSSHPKYPVQCEWMMLRMISVQCQLASK